jgi:hypothetical protein
MIHQPCLPRPFNHTRLNFGVSKDYSQTESFLLSVPLSSTPSDLMLPEERIANNSFDNIPERDHRFPTGCHGNQLKTGTRKTFLEIDTSQCNKPVLLSLDEFTVNPLLSFDNDETATTEHLTLTSPYIVENDDTKFSPESETFYLFNESQHFSNPNMPIMDVPVNPARPASAPPIQNQRGNMSSQWRPMQQQQRQRMQPQVWNQLDGVSRPFYQSPSRGNIDRTRHPAYWRGVDNEIKNTKKPLQFGYPEVRVCPQSPVYASSRQYSHYPEPLVTVAAARRVQQATMMNHSSPPTESFVMGRGSLLQNHPHKRSDDSIERVSYVSETFTKIQPRPVTAPPQLVPAHAMANKLGHLSSHRGDDVCSGGILMSCNETIDECVSNEDQSSKNKNKNLFIINGMRNNKKHFLHQMKIGKLNLDSRILKQLRCSLLDLVEETELFLQLCQNKYGSRYIQKLLDDRNVLIRHVELLFSLLSQKNTTVELCQNISGNYVIQKLLETSCENVSHKTTTVNARAPKRTAENANANANESESEIKSESDSESELGRQESTKEEIRNDDDGIVPRMTTKLSPPVDTSKASFLNCSKNDIPTVVEMNLRNEKLIQLGKAFLRCMFTNNVQELSMNHYSCRVVQRVLRYDNPEYLDIKQLILSQIDSNNIILDKFIQHPFGNHVVQKCIECIPSEYLSTICKHIEGKVFDYAVHIYGCRVMQRLMQYCTITQVRPIYKEILNNVVEMCNNQYANYVVQMMLKLCKDSSLTNQLVAIIASNVDILCPEKFSSNVIEFCLLKCGDLHQKQILDALLYGYNQKHPNKPALVADLVRNEYGNYVIQTMAEVSMSAENEKYRNDLIEQIESNVPRTDLIKYPWGKYVNRRMEQLNEYIISQQ